MHTKYTLKEKRTSKKLILTFIYLMGVMPLMSQRHMEFFGLPVYGKIDKLEKYLEKEGWDVCFRYPNDVQNYAWTPLERRPDFVPANSSLTVSFSSKSKIITSFVLWIRDEKRDSIYGNLIDKVTERYGRPQSYLYNNYTYYLCKNKKGKDIGCIILYKEDNKMDMLIYVMDFKNHFKAFKEGGSYLEYFYSLFTSTFFRGEIKFME